MAYVRGSIPYFECLIRGEYLSNHDKVGQGLIGFHNAIAHAVRCERGSSLWFACILTDDRFGGIQFDLPIEAIVCKPCPLSTTEVIQPWDAPSSDFGVNEDAFLSRGAVEVLQGTDRVRGQYRFTIDWTGSDLARHPEQHKALHVVFRTDGLIGAYPNNKLLWSDSAFWKTATTLPVLRALGGEYRAEGNQQLFK